ncbi:Cyclophilin-like family protein [compost metagenome]
MPMSSLDAHSGDQRPFSMEICHCRTRKLWTLRGRGLVLGLLVLGVSEAGQPSSPAAVVEDAGGASVKPEESRMWMIVGERRFTITLLADTAAARAFAEQVPLTLDMSELNGNEKYADLPKPLPTNASRPGTIRNGDLMLYGSDTLVVFYETFRTSYSYTRLGHVDDPSDLAQTLGPQGVRVTFTND